MPQLVKIEPIVQLRAPTKPLLEVLKDSLHAISLGKTMPLFVVIHKWKKENFKTITKKIIEAKLPKDAKLCFAYVKKTGLVGWCVWEAESKKPIIDFVSALRLGAP